MKLTEQLRELYGETAKTLRGHARRLFQARVVQQLGEGGQRQAQRELGWNRTTIRKGQQELASGVEFIDRRRNNGRPKLEESLPMLLQDLEAILAEHCHADPKLRTTRVYRRLTVAELIRRLEHDKGYSHEQLPCNESIRTRLSAMGYYPTRVRKTIPKKRSPRQTRSLTECER